MNIIKTSYSITLFLLLLVSSHYAYSMPAAMCLGRVGYFFGADMLLRPVAKIMYTNRQGKVSSKGVIKPEYTSYRVFNTPHTHTACIFTMLLVEEFKEKFKNQSTKGYFLDKVTLDIKGYKPCTPEDSTHSEIDAPLSEIAYFTVFGAWSKCKNTDPPI